MQLFFFQILLTFLLLDLKEPQQLREFLIPPLRVLRILLLYFLFQNRQISFLFHRTIFHNIQELMYLTGCRDQIDFRIERAPGPPCITRITNPIAGSHLLKAVVLDRILTRLRRNPLDIINCLLYILV
jgi:hypothetical protein